MEVIERNMAAPQGFEPRYSAPEADVLPLNDGAGNSVTQDRSRTEVDAGYARAAHELEFLLTLFAEVRS